jgi:hypothetical protein
MPRSCSIDGCDSPHEARGWCGKHYQRWRQGRPIEVEPPSEAERFWDKVDLGTGVGCWIWTGSEAGGDGYGGFWSNGRTVRPHRWAYEHLVGPIPDDLPLDHLCRVRLCVNPAHLEPVTVAENLYRSDAPAAVNRMKTHCLRGHQLTGENLYVRPNGQRQCRTCQRGYYRGPSQCAGCGENPARRAVGLCSACYETRPQSERT